MTERTETQDNLLSSQAEAKQSPEYVKKMRFRITIYNCLLLLLSILCLGLSVISTGCWFAEREFSAEISRGLNIICLVFSVISILMVVGIWNVRYLLFKQRHMSNASFLFYLTYQGPKKLIYFILEVCLYCICPYPGVEKVSYWLSLFVALRLYIIFPIIPMISDLYRFKRETKIFLKLTGQRPPKYSIWLSWKVMARYDLFRFALGLFILAFASSCIIAYVCSVHNAEFYSLDNQAEGILSLYWAIQTVTGLGYGDVQLDERDFYVFVVTVVIRLFGTMAIAVLIGGFVSMIAERRSNNAYNSEENEEEAKNAPREASKEYLNDGKEEADIDPLGEKVIAQSCNRTAQLMRQKEENQKVEQLPEIWKKLKDQYITLGKLVCQLDTLVCILCNNSDANIDIRMSSKNES